MLGCTPLRRPAAPLAKVRTLFLCSACGASASKWQGQCSNCGEWNSLEAAPAGRPVPHASNASAATQLRAVVEPEVERRISTGLSELDRVLGGGLVIGIDYMYFRTKFRGLSSGSNNRWNLWIQQNF